MSKLQSLKSKLSKGDIELSPFFDSGTHIYLELTFDGYRVSGTRKNGSFYTKTFSISQLEKAYSILQILE